MHVTLSPGLAVICPQTAGGASHHGSAVMALAGSYHPPQLCIPMPPPNRLRWRPLFCVYVHACMRMCVLRSPNCTRSLRCQDWGWLPKRLLWDSQRTQMCPRSKKQPGRPARPPAGFHPHLHPPSNPLPTKPFGTQSPAHVPIDPQPVSPSEGLCDRVPINSSILLSPSVSWFTEASSRVPGL